MSDAVGNEIRIGDVVKPTLWDTGRGTTLGMLHAQADVLALGRTRILIQSHAYAEGCTDRVGPECVQVVVATDGRPLRSWSDKNREEG